MTTLRKLMKGSLRLINAVAANEEPTDEDMHITLTSLNGLVSSLGNDLLNIYTVTPHRFLLVPGQASYTLGPGVVSGEATGANWVTERPMRIEQAVLLQDANVTFPAPPVPPPPSAFVLDTFTGTGNLSTHVGEIGATWEQYAYGWTFGPGDLSAYVLADGSVSTDPDVYNPGAVAPSGSADITVPYSIEIDFRYELPGAGPYMGFSFQDTNTGYASNWFCGSDSLEVDFYFIDAGGYSYAPGYFYIDSDQSGAEHTVRIEVLEDNVIVYYDGVEQVQFGENAVGAGAFWLGMVDSERFFLSRVEIGPMT